METQRNADDGISAESVNEKAKQGGQGKEKLSSCFCCGGDVIRGSSDDDAGFFFCQFPDDLLLYMNRTLGQVRIFREGSTDIALGSFSGNRTALFYTVHDVFRNSD